MSRPGVDPASHFARYEANFPICRFLSLSTHLLSSYTSSLRSVPGSDTIVDEIERQLHTASTALCALSPSRWQSPYSQLRLCFANAQNLLSSLPDAQQALSGAGSWNNWNDRSLSMALVGDLWVLHFELKEILRNRGQLVPPDLLRLASRPAAITPLAIAPPVIETQPRSTIRRPLAQPVAMLDAARTRDDLRDARIAIRNLQANAQRSSDYIRRIEHENESLKENRLHKRAGADGFTSTQTSSDLAQSAQVKVGRALPSRHQDANKSNKTPKPAEDRRAILNRQGDEQRTLNIELQKQLQQAIGKTEHLEKVVQSWERRQLDALVRDLRSKEERLKSDLKSANGEILQMKCSAATYRETERNNGVIIDQKTAEIEGLRKEAKLLRLENTALKESQDRSARDIGQRDFMIDRLQAQMCVRRPL